MMSRATIVVPQSQDTRKLQYARAIIAYFPYPPGVSKPRHGYRKTTNTDIQGNAKTQKVVLAAHPQLEKGASLRESPKAALDVVSSSLARELDLQTQTKGSAAEKWKPEGW
jgi:hypothetical protein